MSDRLHFRPSDVAETTVITVVCTLSACLGRRRLDMRAMAEAGYDLPLAVLEPRLKCRDRGRDGRKPECGAPVEIDVWTPTRDRGDGIHESLSVCR